ncbi:putative lipoyl (octanoyl) transferase [Leptospirillum ferrooxidans C2-3]|jgi:hypothetical protein|uniref:Putative lipoyl (Octanoyl) transferase n=1 Tax=Leptospirillum ferrooxidans (strain C2-3) TaxID=1162668 RepID=I0IRX7_LEPFC|nr:putative lipoyl (octanoyl) transferase [Leptospirillum ferrooxidans C2-3]
MVLLPKVTLIFDRSLERLLPPNRPFSESWVFVKNWNEIMPYLEVLKPARMILNSRFPDPPDVIWRDLMIPPVILVGEESKKLSIRKWLAFLPVLDQVVSKEEFVSRYEFILDSPPFSGSSSPESWLPLPGGFQDFLGYYQHFKRARYMLTDHQWKILQMIGRLGDVGLVAKEMDRHPRTIRDQIEKIGKKMEPLDVESFFRKPVAAMIDQVPGWSVKFSERRDPRHTPSDQTP